MNKTVCTMHKQPQKQKSQHTVINSGIARGQKGQTAPGGNQEWRENGGDKCKNGGDKGALGISRLLGAANCSLPRAPIKTHAMPLVINTFGKHKDIGPIHPNIVSKSLMHGPAIGFGGSGLAAAETGEPAGNAF